MAHHKHPKPVRCCSLCFSNLTKSTSEVEHVESQISKEVQAKNRETLMRRELEERLKQIEESSRNALDFANRDIASLRQQLNESASECKRLEAEYKQQISGLTTDVYWSKQKVAEVNDENRKLKGEKEALMDTCRQLQREHSSVMSTMEQSLHKNSVGAASKSHEIVTSPQMLDLEAALQLQKSEAAQLKGKISELNQALATKDEKFVALQANLQAKEANISELTSELAALKSLGSEHTEDLVRNTEQLKADLHKKDEALKSKTAEVEDLRNTIARLKQDCEEGAEKLTISQELNEELFEDLRLIKQFLTQVTRGSVADSELNPSGLSSSQILAAADSSSLATNLLERIASSLDAFMAKLKDRNDDNATALIKVKSELSLAIGKKQALQDRVFAMETEYKNLQDNLTAEVRAASRKIEEMRQALASKTALCDSMTQLKKQADEKLSNFQARDEETKTQSHKQGKAKNYQGSDDPDYRHIRRDNERLTDENKALKSETARLNSKAKDLEIKLVDQTEKRSQLEHAYDDIKGYAPEYVKAIITQATKYDDKHSTIESLIAQIDDLKNQLSTANAAGGPADIKTGYLNLDPKYEKRLSHASQETELRDWHNDEVEQAPREKCGCRVF